MAKSVAYWYGTDTFGRQVEVAKREDGVFFERHQFNNGRYGMGTTRWEEHEPTFETSTRNQYSGEVTYHPEEPIMSWGFQRLTRCDEAGSRLRLPN